MRTGPAFDVGDLSRRMRRLTSAARQAECNWWRWRRLVLALLGLSVLFFVAGMAISGYRLDWPLVLVAASAIISLTALMALVMARDQLGGTRRLAQLRTVSERVEARIEHLEDLRWEFQENSGRLRALLDGQEEIIIRRDTDRRITFVNQAFTKKFGIFPADVVGNRFEPVEVESKLLPDGVVSENILRDKIRDNAQLIETRDGPRWIAWSHHEISDPESGATDLQSVGRDVTERVQTEQELADARDAAQAANRAKSRFLASMSHEIRTPMNGILGMSGLLEQTELTDEQETFTRAINKSARTLLSLIDEILDFSKIEAGRLELRTGPFDLAECVQNVVELLAPRAYKKDLELAWMIEADTPHEFTGDEARIRQILLNLVGNAIKFTQRGGVTVQVTSEREATGRHRIELEVRDTGVGLSKDALGRVFMEFERASEPCVPQESGTGLGLAIAKRLAQQMDGDILVDSAPGRGSTFCLSLRLPVAAQPFVRRKPRNVTAHVMLVSSQLLERRVMARLLRSHGLNVTEQDSADDVLALTPGAIEPVDFLLFDGHDEPETATAAFAQLKRINPYADLRSAVLTEAGSRAELDAYRAAGVEQFLVRPVRPESLLRIISGSQTPDVARTTNASEKPHGAARASDRLQYKGLKVLVAEDNEINALLARKVLDRLQCETTVVANGRDAVDAIAQTTGGDRAAFDVVLMDLHMPLLDGFGAADEIRRIAEETDNPPPPIVAVTANAFSEDREKCLAAGMSGYLAKPFEPPELEAMLEAVLVADRNSAVQ